MEGPVLIAPYDVKCGYCGAPPGRTCMANERGERPPRAWRQARIHVVRRRLAALVSAAQRVLHSRPTAD